MFFEFGLFVMVSVFFYVFPNVMIWVFGGVENHQREKDGS